jgi:hypothetical protein
MMSCCHAAGYSRGAEVAHKCQYIWVGRERPHKLRSVVNVRRLTISVTPMRKRDGQSLAHVQPDEVILPVPAPKIETASSAESSASFGNGRAKIERTCRTRQFVNDAHSSVRVHNFSNFGKRVRRGGHRRMAKTQSCASRRLYAVQSMASLLLHLQPLLDRPPPCCTDLWKCRKRPNAVSGASSEAIPLQSVRRA